jgi:hypothetical protein
MLGNFENFLVQLFTFYDYFTPASITLSFLSLSSPQDTADGIWAGA